MRRRLVCGIYIVQAMKDGVTEYWAAATLQENAVAAVEKELGHGWIVTLTDRRLRCSKCALTRYGSCDGVTSEAPAGETGTLGTEALAALGGSSRRRPNF
jgi:hypothetical protein